MPASSISPMLARAGTLPGADEEHAWAFEMKWDGIRALVSVDSPSFERLQRRMHVSKRERAQTLSGQFPVYLFVFDLLTLDGLNLMARPWSERRWRSRRAVLLDRR